MYFILIPGTVFFFIQNTFQEKVIQFSEKSQEIVKCSETCMQNMFCLFDSTKFVSSGPVLVNDMQTLPPFISRLAKLGFWPNKLRYVLKRMKNNFSDF